MNNTMTRVWLDAGFETEQVDVAGRKLVFRRVSSGDEVPSVERTAKQGGAGEHPLFARIRGTAHVPDGVDLTSPADPDWGDLDYGSSPTKEQA